ncbi:MAG: dTDP-4-amino-4,6-dideoxygalactose transaminase [Psychromonas sp.]|jgi:dTDP-4-amino-4,6-dideoxygalactose transaminase|uniref:DegT/DnrJ/EryC1/StrS family aminotransferase n=1 Tax=Psychromonas sp. TaxID=1884585 RepID=UPI0039E34333
MVSFTKSFTQQEAIPEEGIASAIAVMRSGRLHRYNVQAGEKSLTDELELAFSQYLGVENCLACASCGYALHIALKSLAILPGDKVLCNAFTLAPVPGAIHNAGGVPVLVDIDEQLCIDLDDLEYKARHSSAKYLLLSHMRGHIADMDRVMDICQRHNLALIEDCAHTMGAKWNGKMSGSFGDVACFSTQTYKHINSGEGGLLVTPDNDIITRAIIYSGSYMFYDKHHAAPEKEQFDAVKYTTPNYSGRMDNLRSAILLPQLKKLDDKCRAWNARYYLMNAVIGSSLDINTIKRQKKEAFVGSSIQFSIPLFSKDDFKQLIANCEAKGVSVKWFGDSKPNSYTSKYDSWHYLNDRSVLEPTERILAQLIDLRIPLTFSLDDCKAVADIVVTEVEKLGAGK